MTRDPLADHLDELTSVTSELRGSCARLNRWGQELAHRLSSGQRLLVAGNGGSAAEAQHLTAELVGRFDRDRVALSAIALHADSSSVTAIGNDYGFDQVFARQVRAHGRSGDVLLLLSTSGASENLLTAATAAAELGMSSWAMTGPSPNPLAARCDEAISLPGATATVQEAHLVAVHLLCMAVEAALPAAPAPALPAALSSRPGRPRIAS
ncbi:MAG: D-sedoheptulose-7-phosphate isomerase [Pseudonocardia sp.]